MEGARALARALEPSRVQRALCAREQWTHQVHTCTDICQSSCHECTRCRDGHVRVQRKRLKKRVRYNCAGAHVHVWMFTSRCQISKLLSATASAQKDSKLDVRGAVYYQSHGSSSTTAEQPAEL
eukprot:6163536-Pleurochrysis_carterae.AAC.1